MHDRSEIVATPVLREVRDELLARTGPLRHNRVPQLFRLQRHDLLAGVQLLPPSLGPSGAYGHQHLIAVGGCSSSSGIRMGQVADRTCRGNTGRGRVRHREAAAAAVAAATTAAVTHGAPTPLARIRVQLREHTEPRRRAKTSLLVGCAAVLMSECIT